jgi:hypothetical protein
MLVGFWRRKCKEHRSNGGIFVADESVAIAGPR